MPLAQQIDVALLDVAHDLGECAPILGGHLAPVDRRLCVARINYDVAPIAYVAALDGEVHLVGQAEHGLRLDALDGVRRDRSVVDQLLDDGQLRRGVAVVLHRDARRLKLVADLLNLLVLLHVLDEVHEQVRLVHANLEGGVHSLGALRRVGAGGEVAPRVPVSPLLPALINLSQPRESTFDGIRVALRLGALDEGDELVELRLEVALLELVRLERKLPELVARDLVVVGRDAAQDLSHVRCEVEAQVKDA
mmetsp:Transcript_17612/g.43804  ORF Transcript_17612/g.43804 Transcript_17612/m.43804 type:complete len:251 (+) Transcript_17612:33-785(+)